MLDRHVWYADRLREAGIDWPPNAETHELAAIYRRNCNGAAADPPASAPPSSAGWLIDAAALLAEPDPGPTPWLVEDLIVDRAIIAAVGRWKTTKSYALVDLCISIATGEPALGSLAVPNPGPVVYVCEESGRAALWRRLDALCRGRAINPERLRGRLHVATNAGVKLDDNAWQHELVRVGLEIQPRLYVFDPLARMKAATREENAQTDMAVLIEYMRSLREQTGAGVCFVHHTGHDGDHMRGSSDLESAWETKLVWKRDEQSPLVTIKSEHREAEAGDPIQYRIAWHHDTRTMRFPLVDDEAIAAHDLEAEIVAWLAQHPRSSTNAVTAAVTGGRKVVSDTLKTSDRFVFEGHGSTRLWCVRDALTHPDAPRPTDSGAGASAGAPPRRGAPTLTHPRHGASDKCVQAHPDQAEVERLAQLAREAGA